MKAAFGWLKMFACALSLAVSGYHAHAPGEEQHYAADVARLMEREA